MPGIGVSEIRGDGMVTRRKADPQKRGRKTKRGVTTKHKTLRVPGDVYAQLQQLRTTLGPKASLTDAAVVAVGLGLLGGPGGDAHRRLVYELDAVQQELLKTVRELARVTGERDLAQAYAAGAKARVGAAVHLVAQHVPLQKRQGLDLRGLVKPLTPVDLARLHALVVAKGLLKPEAR